MPLGTKTAYAILGLLSREPRSGYDIKKEIDDCISYFWNESYGQIYKVLRELEKHKLVAKKTFQHRGRPTRFVYKITSLGHEELKRYLEKPPQKLIVREELILKLFFGENISTERNIEYLREELKSCQAKLKDIKETLKGVLPKRSKMPESTYNLILARLGMAVLSAKAKWCEESIRRLRRI